MTSPGNLDWVFDQLVTAAQVGNRCPASNGPDAAISSAAIMTLAKQGRIRVEVSGRNFRQITILVGEHKGLKTAGNPDSSHRVWRVTDGEGTRTNTSVQMRAAKAGPLPEFQGDSA